MEGTKVAVTTAGGWMNVRTREQFTAKQVLLLVANYVHDVTHSATIC